MHLTCDTLVRAVEGWALTWAPLLLRRRVVLLPVSPHKGILESKHSGMDTCCDRGGARDRPFRDTPATKSTWVPSSGPAVPLTSLSCTPVPPGSSQRPFPGNTLGLSGYSGRPTSILFLSGDHRLEVPSPPGNGHRYCLTRKCRTHYPRLFPPSSTFLLVWRATPFFLMS